jgi:hypothetical protein
MTARPRTFTGLHFSQLAAGSEFIPLGKPGAFDSHTTYTSWSGGAGLAVGESVLTFPYPLNVLKAAYSSSLCAYPRHNTTIRS